MPRLILVVAIVVIGCTTSQPERIYDLVLQGGTVMDPESGLNASRNVGVLEGQVAAISETPLTGVQVIDATGLVVAPGFIDLHQHGQHEESYGLMVRDGVTTTFELEVGTGDVQSWYAERDGGQVVNYGVSIGHIPVRMIVMGDDGEFLPSGPGGTAEATDDDVVEMVRRFKEGLDQGAVAVGFGLAYTPAAPTEEFTTMLQVAAEYGVSAHIHLRGGVEGVIEALAAATDTGASLHIVHLNSSGGANTAEFLGLIAEARAAGHDVTTEAYPYEASQNRIESAPHDDWESWEDERFQRYQWVETGERLTRETFGQYRQQGGGVIIHGRTEEMTRTAIESPFTMIASDGGIWEGRGHPRSSGTFSKVLGKYVREDGVLDLMDALHKMTLAPARRLEAQVPGMRNKGRLAVGADADLTVFDPSTVIDRATYEDGTIPSEGIQYVLVNGVVVVDGGALVTNTRPGQAVRAVQK